MARKRSEPVPSLSPAHDHLGLARLYTVENESFCRRINHFQFHQDIEGSSWAITCSERTDLVQWLPSDLP